MGYFEKLGKLSSRKLPFAMLMAFPFFLVLTTFSYWNYQQKKISKREEKWLTLHEAAQKTLPQRWKNKTFYDHFSKADRHFIAHKLEKMPFLKEEQALYEKIYAHPIFTHNKEIQKRYLQLTQDNFLSFTEEDVAENRKFWEVIAKQKKPVEINGKDLEKILALIEYQPMENGSIDPTAPHMIIKHMNLTKNKSSSYALSLEVIQREYK